MWGCLDREVISQGFLINMDETQVYYFQKLLLQNLCKFLKETCKFWLELPEYSAGLYE